MQPPEPDAVAPLDLVRNGARLGLLLIQHAFRRLRTLRALRLRGPPLRTLWLASGAAEDLVDAALGGASTQELAGHLARIARRLSAARWAAVVGRAQGGLQLFAEDGGAPGDASVAAAAKALQKGGTSSQDGTSSPPPDEPPAIALPLRQDGEAVGALVLGGLADTSGLRALDPLLVRAARVLSAAQREARKDQFLSLAAHELKTPLTTIKGLAYSLARRQERGEPVDLRAMGGLERQAERLHALLEEMLEVSRMETHRFVLHPESCVASELVESALRSLRRSGIELDVTASGDLDTALVVDRDRMERALTAVLGRAQVQARAGKGLLEIVAARAGPALELRVGWSGSPLTAEERSTAFNARWEAPAAQRTGLGMGLFIALQAARQQGGDLRAEAHGFVLSLPAVASMPDSARAEVLVIDEDELLARMICQHLTETGIGAEWVCGASAALDRVAREPPALLVVGVRDPGEAGPAFLEELRRRAQRPRLVLLSPDRSLLELGRTLGAAICIEKPFAPDLLLRAVQRLLREDHAAPAG